MKLIQLNYIHTKEPIWLNLDTVVSIEPTSQGSQIKTLHPVKTYDVIQVPQKILELIEESYNYPF